MRKFQSQIALFTILSLVVFVLSCKEELIHVVKQSYTISIEGGDAEGATITIIQNGETTTNTFDAEGSLKFTDLLEGIAYITIEKSNYSTVNYIVDLSAASSGEGGGTSIPWTKVTLLNISGSAKIGGSANYISEISAWDGNVITPVDNVDIDYQITTDLGTLITHSGKGKILSQDYEDIQGTFSIDGGSYSQSLPTTSSGLSYVLIPQGFTADQRVNNTGFDTIDIVEDKWFSPTPGTYSFTLKTGQELTKDFLYQ